jgi:tricarboxylate carrier
MAIPLGRTCASCAAGIVTVASIDNAVERLTADSLPPFAASFSGASRFDQSTFAGRMKKMMLACDPTLLVYTPSHIRRLKAELDEFKMTCQTNGGVPPQPLTPQQNRKLWESQRIVSSALHPDTGELIPHPFRMSGYLPFNGPICVGQIASASTGALLFWNWANQSQNALVNYFNRNASSPMSNETLFTSYAGAVCAALSVAYGLSTAIKRRYDAAAAARFLKFVAFPSSVLASSLNCYIVRSPEIDSGVDLLDEDYKVIAMPNGERSSAAAKKGVHETVVSRAILQFPVYFIPPALMATVPFLKNALVRNPTMSVPMTLYLLLVSFGVGLPGAIAIFPQFGTIAASELEAPFQRVIVPGTTEYRRVFNYNKGL